MDISRGVAILLCLTLFSLVMPPAALADGAGGAGGEERKGPGGPPNVGQGGPPTGWALGAGAAYGSSPYKGEDERFLPLPMISYRGERFFLQGPRLGYTLSRGRLLGAALVASYRFDGYDEDDSTALDGMDKRRQSLEGGFDLDLRTAAGTVAAEVLIDLLGRHGGGEVKLSWGYEMRRGRWMLQPYLGLSWWSAELADYYYGVKPQEATALRPAYTPGAALVPEAGLKANGSLKGSWGWFARLGVQRLGDDVASSPIVGRRTLASAMAALLYNF